MTQSLVQMSADRRVSDTEEAGCAAALRLGLLRLSITDRCNFRCRYCMPAEGVAKLAHDALLPLERLVALVDWLTQHSGIRRVRLTGGEPLVRRGVETLVAGLSALPRIDEVTLTTNGSMLPQMASRLKAAGLGRVNISLDSLDGERFAEVTRGASLEQTLKGIAAAEEAGLTPIKLNTVLRRSTWRREVPALLDYAAASGYEIRFIELMRTGTERAWCESEFVSVDEVSAELDGHLVPLGEQGRASARRTLLDWHGAPVVVGWITPRSHPFCASCERLRMDARGSLRRCLMDTRQLDLAGLLSGADGEAAGSVFEGYIAHKVAPRAMDNALAMSQIGG